MSEERLRYIRSLQTLVPLHEHTGALNVDEHGKVEVMTKLPPPLDEYGIPRPEIMIPELLSLMDTQHYVWTGQFDEHHLATPKSDFSVVRTSSEGEVGSAFRGLACLKIGLPRQMHNFSHAVFELPGRPSVDVMRQAVLEVGQAKRLQSIMNEHLPTLPHLQTEQMRRLCLDALARAIDSMGEPQVGIMPTVEIIANLDLDELRISMASILRVRRFSRKHLIHPAIRNVQAKGSFTRVA